MTKLQTSLPVEVVERLEAGKLAQGGTDPNQKIQSACCFDRASCPRLR